jgi:hypothetical protein
MKANLFDEEWDVVASLLPSEWRELARTTGAMRRARGQVRDADTLLQLLMMHVATGLSLKQTVVRAKVQGLASMTDVALLLRLRSSGAWLQALAQRMFEGSRFPREPAARLAGRCVRAVDATTVEEPGATGTDWRVHYCLNLSDLQCDFYEVTDARGGETYKRLPISRGDVVLGDRGYCHREGVAHVLRAGGDVVVRLTSTGFPLLCARTDAPFGLLPHLRTLQGCAVGEWSVRFVADGKTWNARLCALRKSELAADRARSKLIAAAKKKQKKPWPDTLEFAGYVMVLTTLRRTDADTHEVLDLYRARWQIELCFKRLKSLLRLGHVPKRSDTSARAWIQGKLLAVLLIERLIEEARLFSPWGFRIEPPKPVA